MVVANGNKGRDSHSDTMGRFKEAVSMKLPIALSLKMPWGIHHAQGGSV